MLVLKNALRSIFRRKRKNIITLLVSAALTALLMIYMQNMAVINEKINDLYDNLPIEAMFTNSAGETRDVVIPEKMIENINETGFIKEGSYTMNAAYCIMTDKIQLTDKHTYKLPRIIGLDNIDKVDNFALGVFKLQLMENWDNSAFYEDNKVCIVNKEFLEQYELKLGDILDIHIFVNPENNYKDPSDINQKDAAVSLKIIGAYKDNRENPVINEIYCPYKTMHSTLKAEGQDLYASSAGYVLTNTRNLKKFKSQCDILIKKDEYNLDFLIFDGLLVSAAEPLEKSPGIMKEMFPYTYVTIVLISFAVSYIMMHSRRRDMAIMMFMGEGRLHILASVGIENLLICIIGGLIGIGGFAAYFTSQVLYSLIAQGAGYYIGAYIIAYMVGAVMCSILYLRLDVIRMLSRVE